MWKGVFNRPVSRPHFHVYLPIKQSGSLDPSPASGQQNGNNEDKG